MLTCGTYFSGGGVGTIGLQAAGFTPVFAVEYDPTISASYAANIGPHIITARVQDVDPATLPYVDLFQASPVCKEFSVAKTGGVESTEEISQAHAICAYIRHHLPRLVVIENVEGYKRSKSYARIIACVNECGYWHDADVLNSADMGTPQTRRRLIVRAVREGFVPQLPPKKAWRGWYSAIEDLIPTLPLDKFAGWQLKRLENTGLFKNTLLWGLDQNARDVTECAEERPAPTVTTNTLRRPSSSPHAFLVEGTGNSISTSSGGSVTVRGKDDPAFTVRVASYKGAHRAFLVNHNQSGDDGQSIRIADGDRPAFAVTPSSNGRSRAFLIPGDNTSNNTIRTADEPMVTVRTRSTGQCPTRAFIVDGQPADWGQRLTTRDAEDPIYTIQSSINHRPARAWFDCGEVRRMTPRALARFQDIPDWYVLPASNKDAMTIIGNGVPCLMMQAVAESLLPAVQQEAA